MLGRVQVGSVVRVPLHGRRVRAFVIALVERAAVADPSALHALVSEEPLFSAPTISAARWAAERYVSSLGSVLHQATPGRYSAPRTDAIDVPCPQGAEMSTVVVAPSREAELERVVAAASTGERALVIAARTATADALGARIPSAATLHAQMPPSARAAAWARARDGSARVLVATRAGVLAPMKALSLVVVAESHDRSLKEERAPKLHALWVAEHRASLAGAAFLASSPAPPLELAASRFSWEYPARAAAHPVRPEIASPRGGPLTPRLLDAVRWATSRGRDALVFIARRGLALRVRCNDCGWYPRCDRCGTGLAQFESGGRKRLRCRSCGREPPAPATCPDCGGRKLDGVGWGNERLAAALSEKDVGAPILRVDRDSPAPGTRPRPAIVVGTQAAISALAGEQVGAVCVADFDQLLGLPDFRAAERAFQTLQELAALMAPDGRFVLQTRERDHRAVQAFTRRSYKYFVERELPLRREAGYPPYGVVVVVELDPAIMPALRDATAGEGVEVLGPLVRPSGRGTALVRGPRLEPLLGPLRELARKHPRMRIDVDPADIV